MKGTSDLLKNINQVLIPTHWLWIDYAIFKENQLLNLKTIIMKSLFCIAVFTIFSAQMLYSQAPKTMSYQGVLTDNKGEAIPDGSYTLSFALYDDANGGTL